MQWIYNAGDPEDHCGLEIEGNYINSEIDDRKNDCGERDNHARNYEFDGGDDDITNASVGNGYDMMVMMMMVVVVVVVVVIIILVVWWML